MESQKDEAAPKRSQLSILPMPSLPSELISEILLKVPVESLLKLKSVSKSWLFLISSPEFVKAHLLSSASNKNYTHHGVMFKVYNANRDVRDCSVSSLLNDSVSEAIDLDYPGKNHHDYPRLVGSINGLICLAIDLFDLFLWNPSIGEYKILPSYNQNLYYFLAKPTDFKFGSAYDEFQDDYKVVAIFPINRGVHLWRFMVKIYSLRRDSWRRIDDFQGRELVDKSAKFVNGKLHWLDKQRNISSIDLTDEKWAVVEQPCDVKGCKSYGFFNLGVFGNDLSASCNYAWTHADVWVTKEYGVKESWTKIFTIKYPYDDSLRHTFYPPILVSTEGEILIRYGPHFIKYNPKDDSIRYLDFTNLAPCLEAEIYVKNLVCPLSQQGPRMPQQRRRYFS